MAQNYHYADNRSTANPIAAIPSLLGMAPPRSAAVTLADNLRRLMDHHDLSQLQLSKKSGVGQSTLSNLLDVSRHLEINPRLSTLQQLADFFQLPVWQLLVPNQPLELLLDSRIGKVIENYVAAGAMGRQSIERVADSEVRYAMAAEQVRKAAQ